MLTQSSINAAYPLAEKLAAKGMALRAIDQTPLAVLVNHSLSQVQVIQNGNGLDAVPDYPTALIQGSTFTNPLNEVPHDLAMDEAVKLVAQAVSFNLDLAQNTVNPIIKQVVTQTQAHMDAKSSSSLAPLTVVPFYYKAIWDSPVLAELVGRYAELPLTDVALRTLGLPVPANFTDAALTGAGRFDEEVAAFVAGLDPAYVEAAWQAVFGAASAPTLGPVIAPRYDAVDRALLVHLFARRYLAEVPEGVNMEINEWRAYMAQIVSQTGRAVVRAFEKRSLDAKYKNLVISTPAGEQAMGDIIVVGDVYDQWLKDGGVPEVLYGAAVLGGVERGYSALLEKAETFKSAWRRTYTMLQSALSFARFNALVEGLRIAVATAINALPEDQLVVPREVLHGRLKERLTHVKQKDLEDLYHVCRKAVCRVMFPHTDAEQMLLAVDASAAAHPELDLREAALLATVDYVAVWLTKLFIIDESLNVVG